jgi:hypothetical protein
LLRNETIIEEAATGDVKEKAQTQRKEKRKMKWKHLLQHLSICHPLRVQ